jgi:hypothetical protein
MFFYQPSLIGLLLIHYAFAEYQLKQFNTLTPQMILYLVFSWFYLLTHYIKEEFMVTTWDIMEERIKELFFIYKSTHYLL